jgi:hypothetical protein
MNKLFEKVALYAVMLSGMTLHASSADKVCLDVPHTFHIDKHFIVNEKIHSAKGSITAHQELNKNLVITLEEGECLMIKSDDGQSGIFIDYRRDYDCIDSSECYHIDYHVIFWVECPSCKKTYNAGDGACPNAKCPSKIS